MRVVFVGGCHRSGTTMVGEMLGRAGGAVCTPESQFKTDLMRAIARGELGSREGMVRYLRDHWRFRLWGQELQVPPEWLGTQKPVDVYDARDLMEMVVKGYAARSNQVTLESQKEFVWIDHTPSNLVHAVQLVQLFPASRFVHIIRDGRAVAASLMKLDWGPNTVLVAARHWMTAVAHGLAAELRFGPSGVRRVRYEDLVLDERGTLQDLWEFAGLDAGTASGERQFRPPEYTSSQHRLVGSPVEPSRLDAWRRELPEREIELFESAAGSLLRLLGYDLMFDAPRDPSRRERAAMWVLEMTRRQINKCRILRRKTSGLKAAGSQQRTSVRGRD